MIKNKGEKNTTKHMLDRMAGGRTHVTSPRVLDITRTIGLGNGLLSKGQCILLMASHINMRHCADLESSTQLNSGAVLICPIIFMLVV